MDRGPRGTVVSDVGRLALPHGEISGSNPEQFEDLFGLEIFSNSTGARCIVLIP